jgi:predicted phage replisome organizer
MSNVKWIKICVDIFDDEKILLIENLQKADSILVIWFKLLCLAGKQNNSGVFTFQNGIPYTEKMLATVFRRKQSLVKLALKTFEGLGMVEIVNNAVTIPNWGKHQNLDQLEAKKSYMRKYMSDYREKQKKLTCKTNSKANVSSTDIDIERDKDIDIDIEYIECSAPQNTKPTRHKYGEYQNVLLSDEELEKLKSEFVDDWQSRIENLSEYMASSGKSYKNHLATIRKWSKADVKKQTDNYPAKSNKNKFNNYSDTNKPDYSSFSDEILNEMLKEAEV